MMSLSSNQEFDFPAIEDPESEFQKSSATLDATGLYRYDLIRSWRQGELVNFIMLNPSTADAKEDDPTIRRCTGFARKWGFAGIVVTNLFAYRTAYPEELFMTDEPSGPENQKFVDRWAEAAGLVVVAWGNWGQWKDAGMILVRRLGVMGICPHALGVTKQAQPSHPVRLSSQLQPMPVVATVSGMKWAYGGTP